MKIIMVGATGRMGHEVCNILGDDLACGVSRSGEVKRIGDYQGEADGIIDFSFHELTPEILDYAVMHHLPTVIATTGHTPEELEAIRRASEKIPVFFASNMSIGIAVLCDIAKQTARYFPDADIEIIEKHHNRKLDAPSGTALTLAKELAALREGSQLVFGRSGHQKRQVGEIGVHAVRMGNIVGDHEIIIGTDTQRITLKHEAVTRSIFAEGAVAAMKFILNQSAGLYNMKDMIE